ncbi:MAG: outer membrane protein transport protein, partial [Pseudomonadota bacterium]
MKLKAPVCVLAMVGGVQLPVHANHIQSFGQSEDCITRGGACVALAGDFGAFYHNPAAATDFDTLVVGGNFRFLDTTQVDLIDSAGSQEISRSNKDGDLILAPTLGVYKPISQDLTIGVGLGAPFAITADWGNDEGIHRYNMSEQSLYVLDLSPSVAYRVNGKLSVGMAANIVLAKQLRTESLVPQSFGAALPPALGGAGTVIPTTPTSPVIGSITLATDGDFGLGIPPDQFESAFDSVSFTLGAQYELSDSLQLGAVYRSKTNLDWEGQLTLDLSPAGLGVQETNFKTKLDGPAHLQVGFAWKAIPNKLELSADLQRTFWSDTDGFGKPLVIET